MLRLLTDNPAVALAIGVLLALLGLLGHAYLVAAAGGAVAVVSVGRLVATRR